MLGKVQQRGLLELPDTLLACGTSFAVNGAVYTNQGTIPVAADMGLFSAAWRLIRRVCPSTPSAEWWLSRAAVVDGTSALLTCTWLLFADLQYMPSLKRAVSLDVWEPLLAEAVAMVKINHSAGLSGRDTMSFQPLMTPLAVLEVAAKEGSQQSTLMG